MTPRTHQGQQLTDDDALTVLPDAFALDPDRLARFRREAQVLASLNHPNIARVYGLEYSDGVQALVMELVEGPTLANRIARGPISLDEALPIAKQIAEALEAAHELGIIRGDETPRRRCVDTTYVHREPAVAQAQGCALLQRSPAVTPARRSFSSSRYVWHSYSRS